MALSLAAGGNLRSGGDQGGTRNSDDSLTGPAVCARQELPGGAGRDVISDNGEIARFELQDGRAVQSGGAGDFVFRRKGIETSSKHEKAVTIVTFTVKLILG